MEKLVRDNVPALIVAREDRQPLVRVAEDTEYIEALYNKLQEESREVATAETQLERTEELADLIEVIEAIKAFHGIDEETLTYLKGRKSTLSGRFEKRYILTCK